jgi:flagellar motor switch protein FliM
MAGQGTQAEAGRDSLAELFTGASNFVERIPMLRVGFDRAALACTEDLAGASDLPLQMALQVVRSGTAAELLQGFDGASVVGVVHAARWNSRLVILLDRDAVFAVVESMLGGDGSQPVLKTERSFSRIELRVAESFIGRIAKALESGLAGIADTSLALESSGPELDYDAIGRRNGAVVAAKFRLSAGELGGSVIVAIPRAAIAPLRHALSRVPAKEGPPVDPAWRDEIQTQVSRAQIVLSAILDERPATLAEIAGFEVGKIVELNATASSRMRLECNGERLMWCHLGKAQGKYTLRVEGPIDREQEFMDDILAS